MQDTTQAATAIGLHLTTGDNYTNPAKPQNQRLSVSPGGVTSQEKDIQIARYKNIGNAWDVLAAEQDTLKKKHVAHQKLFEAGQAQITAATALTKSSTTWNKFQSAVAEHRISRNEARVAIAAMPIEIERQNVELEKKRENLTKAKMELEELMISNKVKREDLSHQTVLRQLDGIEVQVALPDLMQNISGLLPPTPELVMIL
ncbi:hypothetical protein Ava_D0032 [Trichormus variabilis ATCC 29413]|uniref:Uncharacterized protein n=2 Tax=Anabaena variabilis TaxID=264691 RepID=Q3M2T9_TRIV2|nr:hypothetical protein [Trichormus variabilis]ABA24697.1 hypothetical protein Ava_D0032 [Trichormus variabilis ATCC 29413]MBC1217736.1 hypothetical protein [Trichormus variabilis ARAD]MBC1258973.1 hypothetical protein [Trichormus variabilis V5]MBC1302684.1 hypothetical protein [Trichormus variabilis N2B]MBC1324539.1 hypothetical protein [Trichormus variabilis 9RC]